MNKKFLITAAIMAGVLFNNDIFCCASIDTSKVSTSIASSAGERNVEAPTSLAKIIENPVVNSSMETATTPPVADENIVVKSTMKRIHLTAEKTGSVETVLEGLKKQAVTCVINDLKQQQSEYSSDFQDVIGNYNEYIIAVHIVDRNKLFVKIDVRAAALKEIIDSKFVRNNAKTLAVPNSLAGESVIQSNSEKNINNMSPQLTNSNESAIEDNHNVVTSIPVPVEVYQSQPSEVKELPSRNNVGEQGERRHKWAQNS